MAQHDHNRKIDDADLAEYLATQSGFAFELQCLQRLHALGYQGQHGGSYTDPITRKIRQFDIRARKSVGHVNIIAADQRGAVGEVVDRRLRAVRGSLNGFDEPGAVVAADHLTRVGRCVLGCVPPATSDTDCSYGFRSWETDDD